MMDFKNWLESQGCSVEVTQEDDGSGYVCLEVTIPPIDRMMTFDVTVTA